MARTRQTARRSTGGRAPCRQLATYGTSRSRGEHNPFAGSPQIDVFKETGRGTIVVEGTAEFTEVPDVVQLSFLVSETGDTLEGGIQKVLQKIAQARSIAVDQCGVSNDHISSDSIGSKAKKIEVGYYYTPKNKSSRTSHDSGDEDEKFKLMETKIEYEVKSVVRILLEGAETVESTFSKLCYKILDQASLRTHEAPVYELSEITSLRNTARTEACENAKTKAAAIVQALGDSTIQLGPPISLTDLFVGLENDAEDSFLGNWSSWETSRQVISEPKEQIEHQEGDPKEPASKKTKVDDVAKSALDDSVVEKIFVVPNIKIAACIQAVFEIVSSGDAKK